MYKNDMSISFIEMGHTNYICHFYILLHVFCCFRRSVELNSNSLESYENIMQSSLGFANPGVVEFLLGKLGIDESNPPSLMRGLQRYSMLVIIKW